MSPSAYAVLRKAVDDGAAPCIVGVAADHEGIIYEGSAGPLAVGGDEPVAGDSIFRIASMTKVVSTVAALQLRDGGYLTFDAPVDTYCPEFADVQVLDGFDDGQPRLRAPAGPVRSRPCQGTGRPVGHHRLRLGPAPGLLVRRPRPVFHAAGLSAVPADAARRRPVERHDDP